MPLYLLRIRNCTAGETVSGRERGTRVVASYVFSFTFFKTYQTIERHTSAEDGSRVCTYFVAKLAKVAIVKINYLFELLNPPKFLCVLKWMAQFHEKESCFVFLAKYLNLSTGCS